MENSRTNKCLCFEVCAFSAKNLPQSHVEITIFNLSTKSVLLDTAWLLTSEYPDVRDDHLDQIPKCIIHHQNWLLHYGTLMQQQFWCMTHARHLLCKVVFVCGHCQFPVDSLFHFPNWRLPLQLKWKKVRRICKRILKKFPEGHNHASTKALNTIRDKLTVSQNRREACYLNWENPH